MDWLKGGTLEAIREEEDFKVISALMSLQCPTLGRVLSSFSWDASVVYFQYPKPILTVPQMYIMTAIIC